MGLRISKIRRTPGTPFGLRHSPHESLVYSKHVYFYWRIASKTMNHCHMKKSQNLSWKFSGKNLYNTKRVFGKAFLTRILMIGERKKYIQRHVEDEGIEIVWRAFGGLFLRDFRRGSIKSRRTRRIITHRVEKHIIRRPRTGKKEEENRHHHRRRRNNVSSRTGPFLERGCDAIFFDSCIYM